MSWHVGDVMAREVIAVDVGTPIRQVASLLDRQGISAVPVSDDSGRVVGVVSQADLIGDIADGDSLGGQGGSVVAADVMTGRPLFIGADASLAEAARIMRRHRVRRLLVAGADGKLLGVVSRGDLLRPYARDDAAIRSEIEQELRHRLWLRPEQVRAEVRDGTATLTGAVGRRSTAGIAARLTAAVPGVTTVADRIRYEFDDADLIRSKISRMHPFSAEPFSGGRRQRHEKTSR
jgi:CBS domain-containing protein